MKLSAIAVVLFFAASTVAAAANKKYIVTFPKDTPQGDVEKACQELISQGATITHKYRLIKGFAVNSPETAMQSFQVSAQSSAHKPIVEEDQIVSIQN